MENWLIGPLQTALAIFLIAALMFRSVLISAMLTLTLFITLFAQYGLGGYFTAVENWSGNLAFHLLVTLTEIPYWLVRPIVTLAVYCGFSYPLWKKVFRRRGE